MSAANRNEELHKVLHEATGAEPTWTNDVRANCFGWLHLDKPDALREAAQALAGKMRLCTVTAYSEERDDANKRRRIAYHFNTGDTTITVTIPLYDKDTLAKLPVPSISRWFLNADWNEREFMEMFNIDIIDHPNPKRLFLDERLDAGIMTRLIPFSAMAHGAASNTLWERVLEAKGVAPEDRHPSLAVPAEPIKVEPKVTPVAATAPSTTDGPPTLVSVAAPAEVAHALEEGEETAAKAPAAEEAAAKDSGPETAAPEAAAPEAAAPEAPAKPGPVTESATEAAAPEVAATEAASPETAAPEAAATEAAGTKAPAPESAAPKAAATDAGGPKTAAPKAEAVAPKPAPAKAAEGKKAPASKGGAKAGKKSAAKANKRK